MTVRRWFALRKRRISGDIWPINRSAATPPANWRGWPEGKQFAVVLTHDVESSEGLEKCQRLASLEEKYGFRSSFNFIPEGSYADRPELRAQLASRGFEIGVHDLRHDGRLYSSRNSFAQNAARINKYLRGWNAVGFRGGFMHHNLNWLHDLEIEYDASTFDTDPFEPQPSGTSTIFPFFVSGPRRGYMELPYTLPQDSTIFLLFRETNTATWTTKLDWIAENGGMALVNVHPDYLSFDTGSRSPRRYPVRLYEEFLCYLRERYSGAFWHATPKDLARYAKLALQKSSEDAARPGQRNQGHKIWIDLDNTPHVPFFAPIHRELSRRGYEVVCTARDAFQVCDLANQAGFQYEQIGRHYGRNLLGKALGLFWRSAQLLPFALRERPQLALSHGARSQMFVARLLGIPCAEINDYEFAATPFFCRADWVIAPGVIPSDSFGYPADRVRKYTGLKEDVYVSDFAPDHSFLRQLGLDPENVIITVRPPATEAHYHRSEGEGLFFYVIDFLLRKDNVQIVLLPRNARQTEWISTTRPEWFSDSRIIIPRSAVNGRNLLYFSDLVVGGGGTMNREAAALRVPVYSIFLGKTGAVDRFLEKAGLLVLLKTTSDIDSKLEVVKKKSVLTPRPASDALACIVEHIEDIVSLKSRGKATSMVPPVASPATLRP